MRRRPSRSSPVRLLALVPVVVLITTLGLAACGSTAEVMLRAVPGGNAENGRIAIREYGCGACHAIPGVAGASGNVGPPLTNWAVRTYIAGSLPNTAENLIAWIDNPQAIEPGTAMPDVGIDEAGARDIAAYLATLR